MEFKQYTPYQFINKNSEQVLAVAAAGMSNGTNIIQWGNNKGKEQSFMFFKAEDDYFYIVALHSLKVVAVEGSSHKEGANIVQWEKADISDQRWEILPYGDYFKFKNKNSGQVIAVGSSSQLAGANVLQWPDISNADQEWKIVEF